MKGGGKDPAGPPAPVKAILRKFSSGKEEDTINGYLKLLKIGPTLLKYVPGKKVADLRLWLESYRYWNQGGTQNVAAMLRIITDLCEGHPTPSEELPELQVTPDIGLVHPLRPLHFFDSSPAEYLEWRLSKEAHQQAAARSNAHTTFKLADNDTAPRVAVLLYRKHVITKQRYIMDLITQMEAQNVLPIPIFINGVEAHTIVRDLLTSSPEIESVRQGTTTRDDLFQPNKAVSVDAIVNTVGFPLVGGPAGSMEAGRNVAIAEQLLSDMNVPYIVASPLLLQSIPTWKKQGVLGLQAVALYSLPELDGAIDTVVLGGLVGDKIALVPERVRKLCHRVSKWVELRRTPPSERKIAFSVYGFPPNVGAVGTAALLDVPHSIDTLFDELVDQGYDLGREWSTNDREHACGESLVAALSVLSETSVIARGVNHMQDALETMMERARAGDDNVASTLALPGGGLGGAKVVGRNIKYDDLDEMLGKYMAKKVRRAWPKAGEGPGVSSKGELVVAGLQIGNVWLFVQPLLGLEGDPMRLLFERDLTPHPQYCATYKWLHQAPSNEQGSKSTYKDDGFGAHAMIHLGMHGTVEWLPGQNLGNDASSWSDVLLGDLPNFYVYTANNPSESILAKRRGYATIISYNVPPYGRAGLYLELANLKELVDDYRGNRQDPSLRQTIYDVARKAGMLSDVPLLLDNKNASSTLTDMDLPSDLSSTTFDAWVLELANYLVILQDRLFSSGLHTLGKIPSKDDMHSYLEAYFGDRLPEATRTKLIDEWDEVAHSPHQNKKDKLSSFMHKVQAAFKAVVGSGENDNNEEIDPIKAEQQQLVQDEASLILSRLEQTTDEVDNLLLGLDGGYIPPQPGGDLLRDGPSVLPTGRNMHALDPYRMPSPGAWARGQAAAEEILRQHLAASEEGRYPETVAVNLWGLDAIKTRGESVAIVLSLVGAKPIKEGTGRIVRYELIPLKELGRPRIDILASMSGIFRDSFANIVDLLDDMFERAAAQADEPDELNFIKKHALQLKEQGHERSAARLFSNPPGDYGSMVNEIVGSGDWEDSTVLGDTWKSRNAFAYGRGEGSGSGQGTARPEVLETLLKTTERVVQEIDSVEYGLTDIQEYYANTGALKKAAETSQILLDKNGQPRNGRGVKVSIIETFRGGESDDGDAKHIPVEVRDVEDVLRLEYRSKLLNPKWRDSMLAQGSGGAYEVSQRMTAMVGWAAVNPEGLDNFVFDQAAERYALDEAVASQLQKSNPQAFRNVVRRLLEAAGRGMWSTDESTLAQLKELYSQAEDQIEQGGSVR
jgi:magnesium chelatase subunit H